MLTLICYCFSILLISSVPTLFVEGRSVENARILNQNNGWDRAPVTEIYQNFSVYIPPPPRAPAKIIPVDIPVGAENQLLATYLVPPPPPASPFPPSHSHLQGSPVNQSVFVASEPDPMHHPNHNYDVKPVKVTPPPPTTTTTASLAVVGGEMYQNNNNNDDDDVSSGVSTTGNLYINPTNEHKINTITASQMSRVKPGPNNNKSKLRIKVNVEKFKECIFFRLCEKAKCFHYGRFGVCQGQRQSQASSQNS